MAASIAKNFLPSMKTYYGVIGSLTSVRDKASSSRNRRGQPSGKSRGFKVVDGQFVHSGQTLVTQLGLQVYPGQYVKARPDNQLNAMTDGRVMITWEKLNPYPDSPLFIPVQQGVEIVRQFCHIIPVPLHSKFRLVSKI